MRKCLPTVLLAAIAIAGALSLVSCTRPSVAVSGANCDAQGAGAIAADSSGNLFVCK